MKSINLKLLYGIILSFMVLILVGLHYYLSENNTMNNNVNQVKINSSVTVMYNSWKTGNKNDGVEICFYKGNDYRIDK